MQATGSYLINRFERARLLVTPFRVKHRHRFGKGTAFSRAAKSNNDGALAPEGTRQPTSLRHYEIALGRNLRRPAQCKAGRACRKCKSSESVDANKLPRFIAPRSSER